MASSCIEQYENGPFTCFLQKEHLEIEAGTKQGVKGKKTALHNSGPTRIQEHDFLQHIKTQKYLNKWEKGLSVVCWPVRHEKKLVALERIERLSWIEVLRVRLGSVIWSNTFPWCSWAIGIDWRQVSSNLFTVISISEWDQKSVKRVLLPRLW